MMDTKDNQVRSLTSGVTTREKIGYAFGDLGSQFVFGLIASVLQKYYTDIVGIPIAMVMVLFIVARIWDAVNDPMWGTFVDTRRPHKGGRYRRWMLYFNVPMCVCAVLMFVRLPGVSGTMAFVFACVTYTLFGMVYTCVNVPYGSLASVITSSDHERSGLSSFRSIGSALGTVPALLLVTLFKVRPENYSKIFVGVCIISALAAVIVYLCVRWTKERIVTVPREKRPKGETARIIGRLLRCRPFLVLSVSAMLFLAASVFSQSYYVYLGEYYFGSTLLSLLAMVSTYLPVALLMPFMSRMVRRFGRKEICAAGMLVAGLLNLILFFVHTHSLIVFLVFCFIAGLGNAFLFLQIWALATEVVDYGQAELGITDQAVTYSFFSFIRKLGHAVAAIFVNASLLKIGYDATKIEGNTDLINEMYSSSVLIPAILYLLVFLLLAFLYPLGKKQIARLQEKKMESLSEWINTKE